MIRFREFLVESNFAGMDLINPDYRDDIIQAIKNDELSVNDKKIVIANKDELLSLINGLKTKADIKSKVSGKQIVKLAGGNAVTFTKIDKHPFTVGSAKITAAQWEMIICVAYNMEKSGKAQDDARILAGIDEDKWKSKFDGKLESASNIVKDIKMSGVMKHFGSDNIDVSSTWKRYYKNLRNESVANFPASTKTPKTDMYIGNARISLKKAGGSQLMSGKEVDAWGTIKAGIEYGKTELGNADFKTPLRNIKQKFKANLEKDEKGKSKSSKKLASKGSNLDSITSIQKIMNTVGKGKDELITWVIEQTEMQKEMMTSLNSIMGDKESDVNLAIRRGMVHEAMTGSVKFGPNSKACANHLMKFSPAGKLLQFEKIRGAESKLVEDIAKKVKIDVKFKTSGTGGTAWSALKMILGEAYDEVGGLLLTEEQILNENFIVRWFGKWLDKIWKKIVSIATTSFSKLMELFGLKMKARIVRDYTF